MNRGLAHYKRNTAVAAIVAVSLASILGLSVTLLPLSTSTSSTSANSRVAIRTTSYSYSVNYSAPIPYKPPLFPAEWTAVGSRGLYEGVYDDNVPIDSVVNIDFYAIFNGTNSCPFQNHLNVIAYFGYAGHYQKEANFSLLLVPSQGNTSVYAGSLTFVGLNNGAALINASFPTIPDGCVHCIASSEVYFNWAYLPSQTTTTYANTTTLSLS